MKKRRGEDSKAVEGADRLLAVVEAIQQCQQSDTKYNDRRRTNDALGDSEGDSEC